jgi:cytochrome c oxidase subunit III
METNLTEQELYDKKSKTYKMLLYFAMISIIMIFAGLTSAFIVSKKRPDWLKNLEIPDTFLYSTIIIIISSITYYFALKAIKNNQRSKTTTFLIGTLVLGLTFVFLQFKGFGILFDKGLVPLGASGKVTVSFLFAFVIVHIAHLFGGILSLLIVIYNHYKQKYNASQTLGIELSAIYWHFMDLVWVYLFLFFYFFK